MKATPDEYRNLGPCIPWRKKTGEIGKGYGQTKYEGELVNKHRAAYCNAHGVTLSELKEKKLVIRHKCDNKACINPEHLEAGTHQENMKDVVRRGYHHTQLKPRTKQESVSMRMCSDLAERIDRHRKSLEKQLRQQVRMPFAFRDLIARGLEAEEEKK